MESKTQPTGADGFKPQRIDGYFFLIWGYVMVFLGVLIFGLQMNGGGKALGAMWALTPVLGGIGTFLLVRRMRGREQLFGAYKKQVGAIWSVVGPGMGYVSLLAPNPMGIQLFLSGVAISIHGAVTHFRAARFIGIGLALLSPLIFRVAFPYSSLVFGVVGGAGLFLPGHLLLMAAKRQEKAG
ncbi:MAG: hypothetical protein CSA97_00720 [Bacteroidetes bacterium]|nr:MAG: hypothetical protein CSA97_00720 [Bacteroidota bacterium]